MVHSTIHIVFSFYLSVYPYNLLLPLFEFKETASGLSRSMPGTSGVVVIVSDLDLVEKW